MKKYKRSLFIFRRDLRLEDNTGLLAALESSVEVLPCFILDPRQVGDQPYKGQALIRFMIESLSDLDGQLKQKGGRLYIFEGRAEDIVEGLISSAALDAVYLNADYTPFSRKRDEAIRACCKKRGVAIYAYHDALINAPDAVLKDDRTPYTVYTPYCRKAMTVAVSPVRENPYQHYCSKVLKEEKRGLFDTLKASFKNVSIYPGGRTEGTRLIKSAVLLKNYAQERDIPSKKATSTLSAHHKFGTVSIRETYWALCKHLGIDHTLIKELYWRDFFTQIGYHFPYVLGGAFHKKYDGLVWENNEGLFKAWCEGRTGFPIVDAGMRELDQTGFMHNRVRMITASFLVKDLHIDWQWGERHFARQLVDYDPLVNNGNWQWAASTGCDAQPYFRIFNPWLQQERFDPKAEYIRRWVPELADIPLKEIHHRDKTGSSIKGYPAPIVWHDQEKSRTLRMYKVI